MNPTNFRGRKNARRVNALAEKQHQIAETNKSIKENQDALTKNGGEPAQFYNDNIAYLNGKLVRLQRDADNLTKKVMTQEVAESLRSKKNRSGQARVRA